jgi:hypothetical protein
MSRALTPRKAGFGLLALAAVALAPMSQSQAAQSAQDGAMELTDAAPFSIAVSEAKAKVGEKATILVTVTANKGFKCNDQYPHKIKKISGANVDVPNSVKGSISDKQIVFSIPATPKSAGAHAVTGEIRFSVCNDSACHIKKVALNAKVTGA